MEFVEKDFTISSSKPNKTSIRLLKKRKADQISNDQGTTTSDDIMSSEDSDSDDSTEMEKRLKNIIVEFKK